MSIWFNMPSIKQANVALSGTLAETLGMRFAHVGEDFIVATLPLEKRLSQFSGALHGGAILSLAETLANYSASCCMDREKFNCQVLDTNANHLSQIYNGTVTAMARPIDIGKLHQVWRVEIKDENDVPICEARVTLAISLI